mmetsp:Transcript_11152/g.12783  ORF Transcript_11152/g.12783 Transcript_11152/m.12783 type:complete len:152 (+) Transcript_11152:230-685(+)
MPSGRVKRIPGKNADSQGSNQSQSTTNALANLKVSIDTLPEDESSKSRLESKRFLNLPQITYEPHALFKICVDFIATDPEKYITANSLYGRGESVTTYILVRILEKGNLTVPVVQAFEKVAKEQNYKEITSFIDKLDIFAAVSIYNKPGEN